MKPSQPVTSTPNRALNLLRWLVWAPLVLGLLVVGSNEFPVSMLAAAFAVVVAASRLWQVYRNRGRERFDGLRVDAEGLHFLHGGHDVGLLRYDAIETQPGASADLFHERQWISSWSPDGIRLGYRDAHGRRWSRLLRFRGQGTGMVHFANREELVTAFLRGVLLHRPDLRISRRLMLLHPIDPTGGARNRVARWVGAITAMAIVATVVLLKT